MSARPTKTNNAIDIIDLGKESLALYDAGGQRARGQSTGWEKLDEIYRVAPSQLTVVTGMPGSGKSEWLDALCVNLAERGRWCFAMYSPENYPTATHVAKLVEKRMRKPYTLGVTDRMTREEYREGMLWVLEHFLWLDTALKSPEVLIEAATHYGGGAKLGVVLDPWNTLEHQRGGMSETDYISFILSEVIKLTRDAGAHVWLVVHPSKIQRDQGGKRPVPTPYDLAGSAHWYNKADNIICVHREQFAKEPKQEVEIHVQKVRSKAYGHVGMMYLRYDKVTGRYFEVDDNALAEEWFMDPERGAKPPVCGDDEADAEREAIRAEGMVA